MSKCPHCDSTFEGHYTTCPTLPGNRQVSETPKQLAERRLREMVSGACDVVEQSIKVGAQRNQQTRSADAWAVINAVLKLPEAKQEQKQSLDDTPISEVSETLRLVKQDERRMR